MTTHLAYRGGLVIGLGNPLRWSVRAIVGTRVGAPWTDRQAIELALGQDVMAAKFDDSPYRNRSALRHGPFQAADISVDCFTPVDPTRAEAAMSDWVEGQHGTDDFTRAQLTRDLYPLLHAGACHRLANPGRRWCDVDWDEYLVVAPDTVSWIIAAHPLASN